MASKTPLVLLHELADRIKSRKRADPDQEQATDAVDLIAFTLMGQPMMIEMSSLAEIMHVPETTRLPRVHGWIKGVANVHGRIMPIIDLADYFNYSHGRVTGGRRVIALNHPAVNAGLVIDQVHGLRHIRRDRFDEKSKKELNKDLEQFSGGQVEIDEQLWTLFSVDRMDQSGIFDQIEVA